MALDFLLVGPALHHYNLAESLTTNWEVGVSHVCTCTGIPVFSLYLLVPEQGTELLPAYSSEAQAKNVSLLSKM